MKILMAEDLESVREHFSRLAAGVSAAELRFGTQDATQLLQAVAQWQPDVVIMDMHMRGMMTVAVLEALKKDWPGMAIVVAGFFFEPYYRTAYFRHGADFFFDKSLEWDELIAFLRGRRASMAQERAEQSTPQSGYFDSVKGVHHG